LIQMGVAMRHLSHVISEVTPGAPLVFCGDFNSSPHSGNPKARPTASAPLTHSVCFESVRIVCSSSSSSSSASSPSTSPSAGVFQLLSETVVPPQHADWSSSGPEESCSMELRSAFPPLLSACGQPAYTNYVGGFHGCLDYIFIQPGSMQVLALIPGPPIS